MRMHCITMGIPVSRIVPYNSDPCFVIVKLTLQLCDKANDSSTFGIKFNA